MIDSFGAILVPITEVLLMPVLALLLGCSILVLLHLGGLLGEAWTRRRLLGTHHYFLQEVIRDCSRNPSLPELMNRSPLAARYFAGVGGHPDREKLIDDLRLRMERILERHGLLVRVGPMLGLAGTLIPLGPGLAALSKGDVEQLSANLVVAFTTTVLGLAVGGVSHMVLSVRRRWYAQDLNDLEFLLSRSESR